MHRIECFSYPVCLLYCRDVKSGFSSCNKNVLSGVKLIDWLVQNEIGRNREQAVAFAQDLFGIKILRHSEYKPSYLYPCVKFCTYCMQIHMYTCTYVCLHILTYIHVY